MPPAKAQHKFIRVASMVALFAEEMSIFTACAFAAGAPVNENGKQQRLQCSEVLKKMASTVG